jgi:hypothetical protein
MCKHKKVCYSASLAPNGPGVMKICAEAWMTDKGLGQAPRGGRSRPQVAALSRRQVADRAGSPANPRTRTGQSSPSPRPSPQGEGEALPAPGKDHGPVTFAGPAMADTLSQGERVRVRASLFANGIVPAKSLNFRIFQIGRKSVFELCQADGSAGASPYQRFDRARLLPGRACAKTDLRPPRLIRVLSR